MFDSLQNAIEHIKGEINRKTIKGEEITISI